MSDDRNEGECFGPFHAGFICEDCANRIRALEARICGGHGDKRECGT